MVSVCIVVPIYKTSPSSSELASFRQVLKVLAKYDLFIYTYEGLDLSIYYSEAEKLNKSINVEYFNRDFFSSIKGYNRLCLTIDFYKRVSSFKYMLIYQLDAWVFRDELEFWCNRGYDYVGAPFFTNFGSHEDGNKLWAVGNGGFSLRRISYVMGILSYKFPINLKVELNKGFNEFIKSCLKIIGFHNTMQWYIKHVSNNINEDYFISIYLGAISNKRKRFLPHLPSPFDAAAFSFEQSPSYLYKLIGEKLPFGCHAFEKYEYLTFWRNFID